MNVGYEMIFSIGSLAIYRDNLEVGSMPNIINSSREDMFADLRRKHLYLMEKSLICVELTEGVYVPSRWPLSDIKTLVIALARKIIKETKNVFSILQVNGIPAKLITRKNKSDDMHLFEEISGTETIDAYTYEILLPKDEANIRRNRLSGNSLGDESWPDYVVNVSTKSNKIYYLMPTHLE
ncbi:hypothetical protein KQX54_017193 [Cotesia glomerata]|uniref:Uncharacterized protein n=1 Tax=Cotesia glomerata TaxID=32391 RepID=A0AAV7IAP0_COTGL|nr:hypothetical protein KQX54_017193 [Cotesia glomerata]